MDGAQTETIVATALDPGALWTPTSGDETEALLEHLKLDDKSKALVRSQGLRILARCLPPNEASSNRTGLVNGYVQSGKTMSFTTVIALARDNNYRLIIVVAGTKTNLLDQSTERLEEDLRLNIRPDRVWRTELNPTLEKIDIPGLKNCIESWDRKRGRERKKTILITVMKHHMHLTNLADILRCLDLSKVPALIIDDEADQAGLNNRVRQNDESTTYQTLTGLRAVLPHHTYIAYTATPQALLLISRIDTLSPMFCETLTPGPDYTGGNAFFMTARNLVRTIPVGDLPDPNNPPPLPPSSLIEAFMIFVLGVAAGIVTDSAKDNRSMMVHPSPSKEDHRLYTHWIQEMKRDWQQVLDLPEVDPDRIDLIDEFQVAYDDLKETVDNLPPFDELVDELPEAVREIEVREVNTRSNTRIPEIDWRSTYGKVLVGGNAMDRGFTVKGLTVSYMPRSIGGGNIDTIQQRARFFGYKRKYLGYCRVYLESNVRAAFRSYVEHEELMREALTKIAHSGLPLTEWRRRFFLDPALRPTRTSVLSLPIARGNFVNRWMYPKIPHDTQESIIKNRVVMSAFLAKHKSDFYEMAGSELRTASQRHRVYERADLKEIYEDLLVPLQFTAPEDSDYIGMLLQIERYLSSHDHAQVDIYDMSSPEQRFRGLNRQDQHIDNPFQGANARTGYPGAREIKSNHRLTVQLYSFDLGEDKKEPEFTDVPLVAVYVPAALAGAWTIEVSSR